MVVGFEVYKVDFRRALREYLAKTLYQDQVNLIYWVEAEGTHVVIPVDPGRYEYVIEPEDGYVWLIAYMNLRTSSNTSAKVYLRQCLEPKCVYNLVADVGKGSYREKFFLLEPPNTMVKVASLKIEFNNEGTSTENQVLQIVGVEVPLPVEV